MQAQGAQGAQAQGGLGAQGVQGAQAHGALCAQGAQAKGGQGQAARGQDIQEQAHKLHLANTPCPAGNNKSSSTCGVIPSSAQ